MNLVFASGVLFPQRILGLDYFRDLPTRYPSALFPAVPVLARVQDRAQALAREISQRFPTGEIHIVAHSMGGLDTRYLLSRNLQGLAERVVSLSTISTPHRGSPIADLLLGLLPGLQSAAVRSTLDGFAGVGSGALEDLSTRSA